MNTTISTSNDDNFSVVSSSSSSSYDSVDRMNPLIRSRSLKRQRRVSFSCEDDLTVVQAAGEPSSSWYSAQDYRAFKDRFTAEAKELILRTRQDNNNAPVSYVCFRKKLQHLFHRCCERSADQALSASPPSPTSWAQQNSQENEEHDEVTQDEVDFCLGLVVGLERMTTRKIANDKKQRRSELVGAIQNLQQQFGTNLDDNMRAELLRQKSETISRPSRLFALHLAHLSIGEM